MAAFIQTGIVFAGIQEDDVNASEETIRATNSLLWQQNVFATVVCLLFCFVIRDRPEHPPSLVALKQQEEIKFCQMVGNAIKNKQFVLIILIFGCLDGVFIGIGVVLDPFFKALGFGTS